MLYRIIAYTLFVLGFLTLTFFRHYSGNLIPYPWLFIVLGIIFFLAGFLLLRYSLPQKDKTAIAKLYQLIDALKTDGERIIVDFRDCEIREQNYTDLKSQKGADSQLIELTTSPVLRTLMDHLDDPHGDGSVRVQQSVIIFHHTHETTGQTEKFISPVLSKDKITLSFYLEQQKHTTLYVDKTNRNNYYFDLAFLSA